GSRGREERVKSFLSRQVDGPCRMAYGHLSIERPRPFIVVGTTNSATYLSDPTGNRRVWPVRIVKFAIDTLRAMRDQLWGEAGVREASGESIRLDPSLYKAAEQEQEQRLALDPFEEILTECEYLDLTAAVIPAGRIWEVLGVDANYRNNTHADRVTKVMQRL